MDQCVAEQNPDMEPTIEVHPPEDEAPTAGGNEDGNEGLRKKGRQRKNALYAAILQQMEFYFSDSNLTKDRFLAELVKDNPDVDIEVFLKFNKLRSLTEDVKMIAKALEKSTILQVSEDGTKVRRITPIVEKQNVDDCTVYVQRVPPEADHEWLQTEFSRYGKVTYVSIPKFKNTNKIKGFAFVEFDTPKEAEKCLKDFRARGCELPSQTSHEQVLSITTFQEEEQQQEQKENAKKRQKNDDEEADKSFESDGSKHKKKKKKKSKHGAPEDSETDQSDAPTGPKTGTKELDPADSAKANNKKRKTDTTEVEPKAKVKKVTSQDSDVGASDSNTDGEEKRAKKRKNRNSTEGVPASEAEMQKPDADENNEKKAKVEESDVTTADSDVNQSEKEENGKEAEENGKESDKKKKRKRIRVNKSAYGVYEYPYLGMQVMAKKDWKRLRNKYLDLQRAKMKQLKQHLRRVQWNQWGDRNKMETDAGETKKAANPAAKLEFAPGLIVKVKLNEPCIDPKSFKTEMKSTSSNIKYVDIKDGSNVAYIRCDSTETATSLCEKTAADKQFEVLSGDEEVRYWEQIKMDREEKCGSNVRQKLKGRKKLLKKAEKVLGKHIKFDD